MKLAGDARCRSGSGGIKKKSRSGLMRVKLNAESGFMEPLCAVSLWRPNGIGPWLPSIIERSLYEDYRSLS